MHSLEDYDDSFRNPDIVLHSLPSYNYATFLQEYPKLCVVMTVFCATAISMYLWRLFCIRRKELENVLLSGRFSSSVLQKVQRRIADKNSGSRLSIEESRRCRTFSNSHDSESNELVTSFNELYGKLATAKLRAETKKLKRTMNEEERKEEQLIQKKQLDSICEMIMQEPQKFGFHDKSEITEQMKLYSI